MVFYYEVYGYDPATRKSISVEFSTELDYWYRHDHKTFLSKLLETHPELKDWPQISVSDFASEYLYEKDGNGNYDVFEHYTFVEFDEE